MSFEIVYTSVRRGLRTGSKGFCTVAATEGIPRALQEKMESLSGYSHHEAASGAVNHSHLIVRIQRKVYHILSRVADAGKDYSGRTNKIAHHLALTTAETERYPDGPASLFTDDAFWYDDWDDEPQELSPNRLPDAYCSADGSFDTWESVYGDAGWAGVPGEAAGKGMKAVSLVVPDGHDTMDLLTEAFQLVAPDKRWQLCFSTYFSRQAPGTQCHWKFVLDGTQEARRLRARSTGDIVDYLSSAKQSPADNPYVDAARSGNPRAVHNLVPGKKKRRPVAQPVRSPVDDEDDDIDYGGGRRGRGGRRRVTNRRRPKRNAPPPPRSAPKNPFDVEESENESDDSGEYEEPKRRRSRSDSKIGVWIVMALLIAVVAILAIVGYQQLS